MAKRKKTLGSILLRLVDTRAAGLYLFAFAAAIAIATFIENDFGTSAAQKIIYQSWWFELLLFLFSCSLITNIIRFRMFQQKKWALILFHSAMVIILIGAGITRYFGYEGVMHIREGSTANSFMSAENYINFKALANGRSYEFEEATLFSSLGKNDFERSYLVAGNKIDVRLKELIPNPIQNLSEIVDGKPILKVVFGGESGRSEYYLEDGKSTQIGKVLFNFNSGNEADAFNIFLEGDSLYFMADRTYLQMVMATQSRDTLAANKRHSLKLRSLYSSGDGQFVFGEFTKQGEVSIISSDRKIKNSSALGLVLDIVVNGEHYEKYLEGYKGLPGQPVFVGNEDIQMSINYGAKIRELPFSIKLYDFIMERYPGTNSAASYASEVQLLDPAKNVQMDYRIYMNNILNYGGFRFFQSSFDKDEKGTYLSVNHDFWGTWVSYLGYALLTLGLLMTFFSKNTRFHQLSQKLKNMQNATSILIIGLCLIPFQNSNAQTVIEEKAPEFPASHADLFSTVVVQDFKGRMKPMHTLSREVLRKVSGRESYKDLNADQAILSMFCDKSGWYSLPLVKVGEYTAEFIGTEGKRAAYKDFFNKDGSYKLTQEVRLAHGLDPKDRGKIEKDLIKVDERVNIINMVFSGSIFKIVPVAGDANNTWVARHSHGNQISDDVANLFFNEYAKALHNSQHDNNYGQADQLIRELKDYQVKMGSQVIPSPTKLNAEISLNNLKVFNHLSYIYILLGLAFLALLFISVFKPSLNLKVPFNILLALVIAGFAFHTLGLGLRWYVSGRAPWSNGYESMIYIAWTTSLAGLIFTRKSPGALAATMVLSGTVLLIALLSFLDPQITPLQPVLRSYWLTIHVSLEAGSYGFLMLGAIIGLINLLLLATVTNKSKDNVVRVVREMSYISEMTIIGGVVMISIGTYLGGVWANESWGRYWGWDAKETWALVSILVYAIILHLRIIPKMQGLFLFNVSTLFGLSSIIMTYYGVNYYLSGLHSYAAGDPVPIPDWVYISIASCILITIAAYLQKRRLRLKL